MELLRKSKRRQEGTPLGNTTAPIKKMQTLLQTALRPMRRMRSAALARPTLQSWRPFSTDLAGVVKAEVKAGSIDVARTLDTSAMAKGSGGGGGDSSSGSKSPFLPMGDISKIKDMATPEKITLLVEAFASLNIVEAMLFTEAMKKKLNMPTDVVLTTRSGYAAGPPAGAPAAAAPGAPAGAGAAAAAGAAPGGKPAAAEEKTTVSPQCFVSFYFFSPGIVLWRHANFWH